MIAIRLDKEIHPNYILNRIQQEINSKVNKDNLGNAILYIDVKTISDITDQTILKLEHSLEKLNDNRRNDLPESA